MNARRKLFEEVDSAARPGPAPVPGAAEAARRRARRAIAAWLMALFALVVAMIAVGGATRLTDSGLSITEWRPVTGALPPLSDAEWAEEFRKYQAIPEYRLVNRGMTLEEFRFIYWWEWGHRQLGRLIGLVWAAGFLWFLLRRAIPPGWTARLLLPGVLGGVQGAIGWWMVASGLGGDRVDVASYRLATHLGLAFLILGLIAWYVMLLKRDEVALLQARRRADRGLRRWGGVLVAATFVQILLGALVAGIDAGRGYVDWPLMGGEILPSESFRLSPAWRNFLENEALVQFNHRLWGYLLLLAGAAGWIAARRAPVAAVRRAWGWAALGLFGQAALGVVTVMHAAPLWLALSHQLGAVAAFVLILRARFLSAYPPAQSLRG
ncbi:MAG: heme A synthase [Paracoccaceae bacterium]|nr:MAG: heme A synthase [Paracoccaceae bacterium]